MNTINNSIRATQVVQLSRPKLNQIANQMNDNGFQHKFYHLKKELNGFHSPRPSEKYFVWTALFANGEMINEISYKDGKDTNFKMLQAKILNKNNQLLHFGLNGCGYFFYYNIFDGNIILNEKNIKLLYKIGNNVYPLTDAPNINYDDVIAYKDAEVQFSPFSDIQGEILKSTIYEYNFGYKQKLKYNDGTIIKFQPIVHIPINSPMYINIKLVCLNNDLDGELIILRNGHIKMQIKADLKCKKAMQTNWIVK